MSFILWYEDSNSIWDFRLAISDFSVFNKQKQHEPEEI
jgi:hypothetical protein